MASDAIGSETAEIRCAVEELAHWRRRLEVQIPAARVAAVRQRTIRGFARRARLKGFRKGKAPERIVERHFGPEIEREVLDDLVREGVETGIDRSGLDPIVLPTIENLRWTAAGDLAFAAEFDIRPVIELGRTTGFRVEKTVRNVSEADIDRVLDRLRHERAEWRPVARPAATGDRIVFDSVPLGSDGSPLENERIENHRIELGVGSLLPDFEAGLMGLTAGAEETIPVRFPADHSNEALRGATRMFRVRVAAVQQRLLPELDDAFAASLGSFESLAAARERIGRNLEEELTQQADREVNEALIDEIIAANQIDLPESMIDRYLGSMLSDREGPLEGRVPAEREAEIRKLLRPGAERAMRRHYILSHVADREGLRASDEDVDAAIAERTDGSGISVAEARERLQRSGQLDDLRFHLTMERVFAWLRNRSNIEVIDHRGK